MEKNSKFQLKSMNINNRIKFLRETNNLTQKEMAQILRVDIRTLRNWEMNKTFPAMHHLIFMSKYFHVKVDFIIYGIEK